ncbi:orotidine 5'-phosphate decarboxylase [Helicobacter fennelliae]|uniref:Orotidine 5'-phosphate decarboxylase n=2 Tax=Helicobacter fennelliae TaxID=215 RepID=T1CXA4_9HELI|nr:orotidine-5'-phosphate decarboxylase [Helicobacter fennelliae]GAD18530.1 orotidine 5'-phosphate decarboxylase [Helicobacter fennelliae MRY12-0050]SQB97681.1 orotidine 5'-phosphate decarboxylase [Helicobacter fennelliae]STP06916.1 orotidine 5'-phosphate decarboxylase [Helicobacter fennelliae]STQ83537.1 orotidine 5'-phosphate decarboxylase [Helicobacter fennelliae]
MKLVIALDLASQEENLALLRQIQNSAGILDASNDCDSHDSRDIWVKVGLRSFIRDGIKGIEMIKNIADFKIFLDLKLYDIPNTMADAAYECAKLDIDMITLHSSSGKRAMHAVMERLSILSKRPLVMGVSALTSFDEAEFAAIYNTNIQNGVLNLARISQEAGINGMVCSVQESLAIKTKYNTLLTLTPGIRPFGAESCAKPNIDSCIDSHLNSSTESSVNSANKDDQKRIATIQDAKNAKSDFIVIGRPIYASATPQQAITSILKEINAQ